MTFITGIVQHVLSKNTILCCLILLALLSAQTSHAAKKKYVVNLLSMKHNIALSKVKNIASLKRKYNVFIYSKPSSSGKTYVLAVGYFSSFKNAKKASRSLGKTYKGAYPEQFNRNYRIVKTAKKSASKKTKRSKKSSLNQNQLKQIMNSAKLALKKGNNKRAIGLLSGVLSVRNNKYSKEALEFLGVARERNGQRNHAVNAYNKYIKKYPRGKDTRRVKQRLAVLLTATKRVDRRSNKRISKNVRPWRMNGSLSQSYRNNNGENSDLYTFLSLSGRKKNEDTDIRLQFTGSRTTPMQGNTKTDFQISEVYTDVLFRDEGISTKVGRMRSRSGGLFGRLDGLTVSYDGSNSTKYNFLAGIPVNSARDFLFDTERNKKIAYGINTDISFFDKELDFNLYALEQQNDGILDRQVVGIETRYFKRSISIFSLYDYDISYDMSNIFLLTGSWQITKNYTFFFNVDARNSPLLTTSNALIGQPADTDLGTLVGVLGEDAVRQLAQDRTTSSKLVSIGLLGPWSKSTTIRGDIATTKVSDSPASGGVPATPIIGPDHFYSLQFVTKNYFDSNDTSILQFQFSETATSEKFSTMVTTRLPLSKTVRIAPRATLSFNKLTRGKNRTDLRTSMRTDYRYSRNLQMDVDIGADFSNIKSTNNGGALTNYYLIATYHWVF